ncbi:hypothetical protein SGLAM104S_05593 [Streptomyces glaucescens]
MILALTGSVAVLASTLVLLLIVVFFMVNIAVLVLRRYRHGIALPGPDRAAGARRGLMRAARHPDRGPGCGCAAWPSSRPARCSARWRRYGGTGAVTNRPGRIRTGPLPRNTEASGRCHNPTPGILQAPEHR